VAIAGAAELTSIIAQVSLYRLPAKPAGVRCIQLDEHQRCRLFGRPDRPAVCGGLRPEPQMCGDSREHALHWLQRLENLTA